MVPAQPVHRRSIEGPHRLLRHTHSFEPHGGGKLMKDKVEYALPLGVLGDFFAGGLVGRGVQRIFDFRAKQISAIFKT